MTEEQRRKISESMKRYHAERLPRRVTESQCDVAQRKADRKLFLDAVAEYRAVGVEINVEGA